MSIVLLVEIFSMIVVVIYVSLTPLVLKLSNPSFAFFLIYYICESFMAPFFFSIQWELVATLYHKRDVFLFHNDNIDLLKSKVIYQIIFIRSIACGLFVLTILSRLLDSEFELKSYLYFENPKRGDILHFIPTVVVSFSNFLIVLLLYKYHYKLAMVLNSFVWKLLLFGAISYFITQLFGGTGYFDIIISNIGNIILSITICSSYNFILLEFNAIDNYIEFLNNSIIDTSNQVINVNELESTRTLEKIEIIKTQTRIL